MQLPGPGEVLIRVTHAGINGGCETFRARGEYAFSLNRQLQDFPLGAEGAGVVAAVGPGGGSGLRVGQLVAFNGSAAFAEYVLTRGSFVTPVPEGLGGAEATALVLSGVTACAALEVTAALQPGEAVAVTAAAGGTGHFAVQLAALRGARCVVAVVGGPRKAETAAALGATHVIDYKQQDVASELRRICPGGLDVVYEGVGGPLREQLLGCLGPKGRLLQVGYISEYPHTRTGNQQDGCGPSPDMDARPVSCAASATAGNAATAAEETPAAAAAAAGSRGTAAAAAVEPGTAAAAAAAAAAGGHEAAAASADGAGPVPVPIPPSSELFWGGLEVRRGEQRIIGQIWPKDPKAILRCRRRVFDLARSGQLKVLTDQGHGAKGVDGVTDAVDYMLRGEHVGKVAIQISP